MDPQLPLIREKVLAHCDYLNVTIAISKTRIAQVENDSRRHLNALSARGSTLLLKARRMVSALERRLDQLTRCLNQDHPHGAYDAFRLSQTPIPVPNDAVHALLTEAPLPDMNPLTAKFDLDAVLDAIPEKKRAN